MRILDRYIIKSFLVNYLLALGVMVGMYVLLDLIVNVQDFARGVTAAGDPGSSAWDIARDMADYYAFQVPVIFQQVSGAIPTLAAGFTMMRMTRHHELTAMLASGVSLYRVAAPIILISTALAAVQVANQELVISQPYVIDKLMRKHNEVRTAANRNEPLMFIKDDKDGSLLSAVDYDPVTRTMKNVSVIYRDDAGRAVRHKVAESAQWMIPPGGTSEAWVMKNVVEQDDNRTQKLTERVAIHTDVEISTSRLTPEQLDLVLSKKAVDYLSSEKVWELASASPEVNRPILYKIMHLRFTQPLMNIVMLLIGVPFLLTREPNKLVVNMGVCTAVSTVVFVATFVIFQMGGTQLDPLLAAWLPVLIFGPFAVVMLDVIKT